MDSKEKDIINKCLNSYMNVIYELSSFAILVGGFKKSLEDKFDAISNFPYDQKKYKEFIKNADLKFIENIKNNITKSKYLIDEVYSDIKDFKDGDKGIYKFEQVLDVVISDIKSEQHVIDNEVYDELFQMKSSRR